ncbi:GNAT family N-acetyltransferase [Chromobacterium alkanivorans]|uniref:GNAT family N-acetyltransferase n=1 Tax=Chromobacterium alkanivorans TaxID=1071719 RepID=UPI002167D296|nr:GNAT family N-acetyltransferase [Chromobacterium alkanivorans]
MSAVCRRQDAIVLRPMQVQDFPAVLQVQQHCYPPSLIESRDALASRHRLSPDAADTLFIHDLALHPDARGHGLGPRLVQTVLGQGRRRGLRQARLVAVQGAARYWRRFGYQACARDDYTRRTYGESAVGMQRPL